MVHYARFKMRNVDCLALDKLLPFDVLKPLLNVMITTLGIGLLFYVDHQAQFDKGR